MENITLENIASLYGISVFVAVLIGIAIKPTLNAWKGEDWKWYIAALNLISALLGALTGVVSFGLMTGWQPVAIFLGVINGVYAAAAARGLYEMQRARKV